MKRGLPKDGAARDARARRAASPNRASTSSARAASPPGWQQALLWIVMLASAPLVNQTRATGVSALYGFLGLWLSYRLALRFARRGAAFVATIAIWAASPLTAYLYLRPLTTEMAAMFSVALILTVLLSIRDGRGSKARGLAWAIGGALAIAGIWFTAGPKPAINWAHPQLVVAARVITHIPLVWAPALLMATAGLAVAIRRQPAAGVGLVLTGALFFYLAAAYGGPADSSAIGRLLLPLTPMFVCGLSALVDALVGNRGRLAWAGALSAVLILALWNAGMIAPWRNGGARSFVIRYVNGWQGLVKHLGGGARE